MFVVFFAGSISKVLGVALKSRNSKGEGQHIDHVRTFILSMSINAKLHVLHTKRAIKAIHSFATS